MSPCRISGSRAIEKGRKYCLSVKFRGGSSGGGGGGGGGGVGGGGVGGVGGGGGGGSLFWGTPNIHKEG